MVGGGSVSAGVGAGVVEAGVGGTVSLGSGVGVGVPSPPCPSQTERKAHDFKGGQHSDASGENGVHASHAYATSIKPPVEYTPTAGMTQNCRTVARSVGGEAKRMESGAKRPAPRSKVRSWHWKVKSTRGSGEARTTGEPARMISTWDV